MADPDHEAIGEAVDQLLTIDVGGRGVIGELYEAAYRHHDERSPTLVAAERLNEAVEAGDDVFITTGFLLEPTFAQETDGPPGSASLARAIKEGLGAHPWILAEEEAVPTIEAAARGYGLHVADGGNAREADATCTVLPFPTDPQAADERADELLAEHDPSAVVALERCGANHLGEYHRSSGGNVTDVAAKTEALFDRTDALTVGIGDGGNEVGMGTIRDRVREVVPNAIDCGCGCGGGIAAASEADVIVAATVSNWGGYGIAALLSALLDEDVLHSPELERRALVECGLAGAIDATTGRADGTADGLAVEDHANVVGLLHSIATETQR